LKAIKLAEKRNTPVSGIVVNRVSRKSYELSIPEIREMLGKPVIGIIPEDGEVPRSIAVRGPVTQYNPRCKSAIGFKKLAANLLGEEYKEKFRISDYLFGWMR